MKRLCEIGDVIKSKRFIVWRPRKDGSFHLSDAPNLNFVNGNEWMVVDVQMTGGGTGHGPHDVYPDGHEVTIQMLHSDKPSPDYTLKFYQSGCFNGLIPQSEIQFVKKLQGKFVKVWVE